MAQNWHTFQYGLPPAQDGMAGGSYNAQAAHGTGPPGMPLHQNPQAFHQNANAPSVNPLANADPAHIAALLQQLQAAGYSLPPLPAAPQPFHPSQPQPSTTYTPPSPLDGRRAEGDMAPAKAASEEGELSGDDDEEGTASEYDPAQPAFPPADAHKRDKARRRLSDERRYDRYNSIAQRSGAQSWKEPYQSVAVSAQDGLRPSTPRSSRRRSPSPARRHNLSTDHHLQRTSTRQTNKGLNPRDPPNLPNAPAAQVATPQVANVLVEQIVTKLAPSSASEKSSESFEDQSKQARNFVSLLNFYGLVFQSLVQETSYFTRDTDWQHLAKIYEGLHLPVPTAPRPQTAPMGQAKSRLVQDRHSTNRSLGETPASASFTQAAAAVPELNVPAAMQPKAKASTTATEKPPAAPKPAESRAAYLAKLKAAKMKVGKSGESGVKSASASATPPVQTKATEPQPVLSVSTDSTATDSAQGDLSKDPKIEAAARAQAEVDARKKRQTELLQQRLAALKAKQASSALVKPAADQADPQTAQQAGQIFQNLSQASPVQPVGEANLASSNGFPGLAMPSLPDAQLDTNTAEPLLGNLQSSPAMASLNSSRKRPVAADFEDFKPSPSRPFKQARSYVEENPDQYEPMVIDVSDDGADTDDGGVGVGVDADVSEFIRSTAEAVDAEHNRPQSIANAGPGTLPDFPGHGWGSNTSSLLGTPGISSTPGNAEFEQQLARSELQIAEMKAKIAARQALQRRKLNGSRPETPQKSSAPPEISPAAQTGSVSDAQQPPTLTSSTAQSLAPAEQHIGLTAETPSIASSSTSTVPQGQPSQAAAPINGTAMPGLDQGSPEEASAPPPVSAVTATLSDDDEDAESETDDEELYTTTATDGPSKLSPPAAAVDDDFEMSEDDEEEAEEAEAGDDTEMVAEPSATVTAADSHPFTDTMPADSAFFIDTAGTDPPLFPFPDSWAAQPSFFNQTMAVPPDTEMYQHSEQHDSRRPDEDRNERLAADCYQHHVAYATGYPAHEPQETTAESPSSSDDSDEGDDDDDFYSTEAHAAEPEQVITPDPSASDSQAPSYPISVSELEAESEQISEEEGQANIAERVSDGVTFDDKPFQDVSKEATESETGSADEQSEEDSDADDLYEPAPPTEAETAQPSSDSSISESPRSSAVDDLDGGDNSGSEVAVDQAEPTSSNRGAGLAENVAVPILQTVPANTDLVDSFVDQVHYEPYQSPLRMFKDYRYHPQFSSDIQGGYRSMTYSHQIDANRPVCPYEADGGVCNDPDCQGQHFKGMQLSDDMVLVQLGTKNPGRSEAEKAKWNDGLREVLKQLRSTNTRDPDEVATAITTYRRKFLEDPTRVLHM